MTGLQEAQKFQKHLGVCKKHPERKECRVCQGTKKVKNEEVGWEGIEVKCWHCNGVGQINPASDLREALKIRAGSGQ